MAVTDPLVLQGVAARVEQVLRCAADRVAPVAIGAWTLVLPALGAHYQQAQTVAEYLRVQVRTAAGVPCVLGLGAHAGIARIAATVAGAGEQACVVVAPGTEAAFLAPLPLRLLPGVGPQTAQILQRFGIATVGQLAQVPRDVITRLCGPRGRALLHQARGEAAGDTCGASATIATTWQTVAEPCAAPRRLHAQLYALTAQVGGELRAREQAAGAITVRLAWTDGTSRQRTVQLAPRCDLDRDLALHSRAALEALLDARRLAVQTMTVTLGDLGPVQHDLFTTGDTRSRRLQQALDRVTQRYGPGTIQPAALLGLATYGVRPRL